MSLLLGWRDLGWLIQSVVLLITSRNEAHVAQYFSGVELCPIQVWTNFPPLLKRIRRNSSLPCARWEGSNKKLQLTRMSGNPILSQGSRVFLYHLPFQNNCKAKIGTRAWVLIDSVFKVPLGQLSCAVKSSAVPASVHSFPPTILHPSDPSAPKKC